MPYRNAHWYLLALLVLAGFAFWPSYISQLRTASPEFHAHGISATLWMVLLITQSWTMRNGQRALHSKLGLISLLLFPLFLAGGSTIFVGMAQRYAEGAPFQAMYGPRLAWLDFVGVGGFAYFYYEALRQRRKVHPHSRYMLATVIFLLPPIFGRLSGIPLGVRGPEQFERLSAGFQAANLLTAAIAFWLAYRSGKHGRPWVLAGIFTLVGAFLYQTVGATAAWEAIYARSADLPSGMLALSAGLVGIAVAYAGWTAGKRPVIGSEVATA